MAPRWAFATAAAAAVVLGACAPGATRPIGAASSRAVDPDRWERAACLRDEYPPEIDDGALARARHEDVRAKTNGRSSPFAAARLEDRRATFKARCASWRGEAERRAGAGRTFAAPH